VKVPKAAVGMCGGHELLGEILGAFQLGGGPGRTEDLQPGGAEGIHHAGGQGRFRAHHGELDAFLQREFHQFRNRR
jgi:hypothetical protein